MPGMPAAGGWGGSNRTLGITVEGFTEEEVCFNFSAGMTSLRSVLATVYYNLVGAT
jgi:hypothetical protein